MPAASALIARHEVRAGLSSDVVGYTVWAAILFNLGLCFVDTHLIRISALHVMAAEAAILGSAFLLPFTRSGRTPGRLDVLLLLLFATWLLLSILRQDFQPKFFRDVAIIAIFVTLGIACVGQGLHRRIFWLHMLILGFAIWEAVSVESFVRVFSVAEYFEHTRGQDIDDWSVDIGLYLSAIRPEDRFLFNGLPVHRLSSVFLEPVSLGNYVVIATIWLAGFWKQIPTRMRAPAVIATLLLLVGSDSRMATVSCAMILLALPFRRLISNSAPVLMAPLVLGGMFFLVWALDLETGMDNFEGRLAHAVSIFHQMELQDYAGVSLEHLARANDAGFAYLVMTQTLVGAAILWSALFLRKLVTPESRYIHLAISIYVAFNLTVSWSLFSIKTAALVWVLLGRAVRDDRDAAAVATATPAVAPPPPFPTRRGKVALQRLGAFSRST